MGPIGLCASGAPGRSDPSPSPACNEQAREAIWLWGRRNFYNQMAVDPITIRRLLKDRECRSLKDMLSRAEAEKLAALWPELEPMEKLACYKLLASEKAWALFQRLSFEDRYFLFSGFPLECISPILEELTEEEKRIFSPHDAGLYERMLSAIESSPSSALPSPC